VSVIQRFNPINKEEQREKFLFDPYYNPQFKYDDGISDEELSKYGQISDEYQDVALHILQSVIKKYGSESQYLRQVEGELLTQQQVTQAIENYLVSLGLAKSMTINMTIKLSRNFIARTSVYKNTINVRLPIEHREKSLKSTLNHEIATHYLRNINDERQPWHKNRKEFGLRDYIESEEGLAVIHYYLDLEVKYLWLQAMYYYAATQAVYMTFSELFLHLEQFIDDRSRRWKICLRVKRGLRDTSIPGVFTRDQVYFKGTIRIAKWLVKNDFDPTALYVGKIDILDLPKVKKIQNSEGIILPPFLQVKEVYINSLKQLIKDNNLPI